MAAYKGLEPSSKDPDVKDRYASLRNEGRHSVVDDGVTVMRPTSTLDPMQEIDEVLATVDSLTEDIDKIEQHIQRIAYNHTAIISSINNEAPRQENEELHEKVKQLSHRVTDELKKMKQVLDRDGMGPERNSADYRIRKAQYSTVSRKFRDVMMQYHKEEDDYREKNKAQIQRQLNLADPKHPVSEEKVEAMLEEKDPQVFTQNILGTAHQRRMLTEVETRHREIIRLEENIKELHEMFYDLAQLVYEQGELINNIEYNVEHAGAYIERGAQIVRTARDYKRKNNTLKLVICCVITAVVIVIVVAIIIAAAVGYVLVSRR